MNVSNDDVMMTTQMEGMMESMAGELEGDLDQMMAALGEGVANNQVFSIHNITITVTVTVIVVICPRLKILKWR